MSQVISSADMIVIMKKGQVMWMGNSREFSMSSLSIHPPIEGNNDSAEIDSTRTALKGEHSHLLEKDGVHINECVKETIEEEQRLKGRVEISVYKSAFPLTLLAFYMFPGFRILYFFSTLTENIQASVAGSSLS